MKKILDDIFRLEFWPIGIMFFLILVIILGCYVFELSKEHRLFSEFCTSKGYLDAASNKQYNYWYCGDADFQCMDMKVELPEGGFFVEPVYICFYKEVIGYG